MRNYYELLGISINATEQEIRAAYHKQARKYHPDNNPEQDTTGIMQELTLAYNTLCNASSRRQYDSTLKQQYRTSTSHSTGYSSKTPNTDDFWSAVDEFMRNYQEEQARMKKQQQDWNERTRKFQQDQEERLRRVLKEQEEAAWYKNMNNIKKNIDIIDNITNCKSDQILKNISKVKVKNFK